MTKNQDTSDNCNPDERLEDGLQHFSMSAEHKANIRRNIHNYISKRDTDSLWRRAKQAFYPNLNKVAVAAAALLFLLGGVTYSARTALPTEPLYGIKTNVNEAFTSLTSWSDSEAAETQSELAARRLRELQTLVRQENLTTTATKNLLSRISKHTKSARKRIAELRTESKNKQQRATQLESRLTALLAANSQALRSIAQQSDDRHVASTTHNAARRLLALAQSATSSTASTSTHISARTAVLDLLHVTTKQLTDVSRRYKKTNRASSSRKSVQANQVVPTELITAAATLRSATRNITNSNYNAAVQQLESVLAQIDSVYTQQKAIQAGKEKRITADRRQITSAATTTMTATSSATSTKAGISANITQQNSVTGNIQSTSSKNVYTGGIASSTVDTTVQTQAAGVTSKKKSVHTPRKQEHTTSSIRAAAVGKWGKKWKKIDSAIKAAQKLVAQSKKSKESNEAATSTAAVHASSSTNSQVKPATSSRSRVGTSSVDIHSSTTTSTTTPTTTSSDVTDEQAM